MSLSTIERWYNIVHRHTPTDAWIVATCIDPADTVDNYAFIAEKGCDRLIKRVLLSRDTTNVYLRLTPLTHKPLDGKRGGEADSAGSSVLWAEVDNVNDIDATIARLETLPKPPRSMIKPPRSK